MQNQNRFFPQARQDLPYFGCCQTSQQVLYQISFRQSQFQKVHFKEIGKLQEFGNCIHEEKFADARLLAHQEIVELFLCLSEFAQKFRQTLSSLELKQHYDLKESGLSSHFVRQALL